MENIAKELKIWYRYPSIETVATVKPISKEHMIITNFGMYE
jgi:hypothetical protein